ncbi:MAG: TldD/PmbA family protein [Candidatus Eremiobacteraeota bacterium]|nr:TldD/PmbA family protein [Candidatus Eremiobacteraeota bacterium]MBV8498310.1 TldD/PmbA family protein [Candidatus Eremiobacteraeota bacterium]
MDESAAIDLAQHALEAARSCGAQSAEAAVSIARRLHVEARENAVARLEGSTAKGLLLRVFRDGRRATLATSDFSADGVADAVRRAVAHTQLVAADEFAGLPDRVGTDGENLSLCDPGIAQRDSLEKIDEALRLERLIRDADARVVNSSGSHYTDAVAVTALANTNGFAAAYAWTRVGRSTGPVALDNGVKRIAHYGTAARHARDLEGLEAVATAAVRRAVDLFGARKPPTMRVPVIFERDVAASILDDVFAAASSANVAVANSWLTGRVGNKIGSDLVSVVDDGRLIAGLGSAPFDGEGVPTRRTPVFERGVLQTFLYDTYYARKLGAASTGNSTGGGVGPSNFYLEPGSLTLAEVIAATPLGVLVVDTIGFATEHASGTYSRGARGFFIEGGEIAYPIDEFTVAGQYAEMLAGVDAVANDLRFDAAVVAPSFRVAEMTVSGN